ncbi:uncharacterized protein LOC120624555 [Pararge aegeria]|uniref:uncharacterized protein LOC120624555 n=1 Tax=Pararge aegeria TaxID=116150 RepID=UPI0019D08E2D|nr:uncharacterized protein LOC120624555 [Pararge aegeria]
MFTLRIIFLIVLQLTTIEMYSHNKPLAQKIWSDRCVKNSVVLNDCNWCRCNAKQKYECKARVCEEIDMFGHFKDAIHEIDVGMEGHGSWRTKPLACTPGVHYLRRGILCVCDEYGNWPNPVCRDLLQVLHSVELIEQIRLSQNESCTPTKLYLVGCNVCFCPSLGYLNPTMCTKKECQEDDPILETNRTAVLTVSQKNDNDTEEVLEVYATCDPKYKYILGCRNCECLSNNRLICGNCSNAEVRNSNSLSERTKPKRINKPGKLNKPVKLQSNSICHGKKPLRVFKIGCNFCHCGKKLKMFCTIRKCINRTEKLQSMFEVNKEPTEHNLKQVVEPPDDVSCVPGTAFKRDCNICECSKLVNGIKHITCTRIMCNSYKPLKNWDHSKVIDGQKKNCVPGTFYQENCMVCHCYIKDKIKREVCRLNEKCVDDSPQRLTGKMTLEGIILQDVNSLYGFCEPMRKYRNDCNICRCLADGKTVECDSRICAALRSADVSVDIVPVVVENGEECRKGQSYKLDCNLCFCLSNGNSICTTNNCSNEIKITQ